METDGRKPNGTLECMVFERSGGGMENDKKEGIKQTNKPEKIYPKGKYKWKFMAG